MNDKRKIALALLEAINNKLSLTDIIKAIEKPKYAHLGDYAFPCFTLAKIDRQPPSIIAIS